MRVAITLLALALCACASKPGAPGELQRTVAGKHEVSFPGHEAVVMRIELPAGAEAPMHTHPGDEITYVLEGECIVLVEGEPPRTVRAGESFAIPAGKVHGARNASGETVRAVGVYVVWKNQPLATPAK